MKTKKMSLKEIQGVLSRAEMKKIMAGSGGGGCSDGNCQGLDCPCNSIEHLNCCNGLVCASYSCQEPTMPQE